MSSAFHFLNKYGCTLRGLCDKVSDVLHTKAVVLKRADQGSPSMVLFYSVVSLLLLHSFLVLSLHYLVVAPYFRSHRNLE